MVVYRATILLIRHRVGIPAQAVKLVNGPAMSPIIVPYILFAPLVFDRPIIYHAAIHWAPVVPYFISKQTFLGTSFVREVHRFDNGI